MRHTGLALLAVAGGALLVASIGCGSLGYGVQAVAGGLSILARREPLDARLQRRDLPSEERRQLTTALAIRDFAVSELGLPDNRSYRSYVRLGRAVATWNVVAAPALSVEPQLWCFPVAGCVSYRGYFRQRSAQRYAARLAGRGYDVTVRGASAYSTLGWFADPLLDTFLFGSDAALAGLIFHELAHQVLYLPGDTAFNESFATTVEELGVERWLAIHGDAEAASAAAVARRQDELFQALLLRSREELAALYGAGDGDAEKLSRKRATFARLGSELTRLRATNELGTRFDGWLTHPWNNADLAAVADYNLWVPALRALFEQSGNFADFYRAAREIAELPALQRQERLERLERSTERALDEAGANRSGSQQETGPGQLLQAVGRVGTGDRPESEAVTQAAIDDVQIEPEP